MLKRIKLDTPSFGMEACHQIFAMIYANGGAWHDVGVKRKRRGIVSPQISEHHALHYRLSSIERVPFSFANFASHFVTFTF